MEKKEFFASQPIGVRLLPSIVIAAAVFLGPLVLTETVPQTRDIFEPAFSFVVAAVGIFVLFRYFRAGWRLTKNPVPLLTLDEATISTPLGSLKWSSVGSVNVRNFLWRKRLCISTINDNVFLSRLPAGLALFAGIRTWIFGAPMVIGPLRGISYSDLCSLIDQYRAAAGDR